MTTDTKMLIGIGVGVAILYYLTKKKIIRFEGQEEKSNFIIASTAAKRCLRGGGAVTQNQYGQYCCNGCGSLVAPNNVTSAKR